MELIPLNQRIFRAIEVLIDQGGANSVVELRSELRIPERKWTSYMNMERSWDKIHIINLVKEYYISPRFIYSGEGTPVIKRK